jgi:hypothetical protein
MPSLTKRHGETGYCSFILPLASLSFCCFIEDAVYKKQCEFDHCESNNHDKSKHISKDSFKIKAVENFGAEFNPI